MHDPVGSKRGIHIQLKGAKNFDCDNGTDVYLFSFLFTRSAHHVKANLWTLSTMSYCSFVIVILWQIL